MRGTKAIGAAALVAAAAAVGAQAQGKGDRSAALSGNPAEFFGADNYPPEAIRKGEQGRVVAKLTVGADGRVTACDVDQSSGSPSLDSTTCDIAMKRVTFTPARDRRGRAIASTYVLPVRWVLPDENAPTPRVSFDQRLELDIAADDKLLSCKLFYNAVAYPLDNPACQSTTKLGAVQLHALKGELAGAHAIVTFRHAVQFEGAPVTAAPLGVGGKVLRLTRTTVDVLPDGTAANARVVEQVGLPDMLGMAADKALGLFAASPDRTDKVTLIDSLSVALASPAGGVAQPQAAPGGDGVSQAVQLALGGDCAGALTLLTPALDAAKAKPLSAPASEALAGVGTCELRHGDPGAAYPLVLRATTGGAASSDAWRFRLGHELDANRAEDAVRTVEALAGRAAILNSFEPRLFYNLDAGLRSSGDVALRRRLLRVLATSYAPDPIEGSADAFRASYARLLLKAGDRAGARTVAQQVTTPLVLRDLAIDPDLRQALPANLSIKAATERQLAADRGLMQAHPDRLSPLLDASMDLRQLGRPQEALQLLETARAKLDGYKDAADRRAWWWDALHRTQLMLGQPDAAIASLRAGMAVSEAGGRNVSQVINLMSVMNSLGRPQGALDTLAAAGQLGEASPFGEMQLRIARGCANAQLGWKAEAAADRAYLQAHRNDAPTALGELLMCMGEYDAAAAELRAQLADPEARTEVLTEFSSYAPPPMPLPETREDKGRRIMAARADVQAALAKAGGVATLDVQRTRY